MKYYLYDKKTKKINKKRLLKVLLIAFIIVAIIAIILAYKLNENFKEFFDKNILRKEITQENTVKIEINSNNNPSIYAYYRYITILDRNILEVYTNSSNPDYELEVAITNPIYASNNRFLVVAEKEGSKIYLIEQNNIVWQKDVEGKISKVNVNKNGYVSIVVSNAGYKAVILTLDPDGTELFKTYLGTTYALDVDISNDNKYLAIAEADTSGTYVQCNIKIISMDLARTQPSNSVIQTFKADSRDVVTKINYQTKNNLVCMYDSNISVIQGNQNNNIQEFGSDVLFADINLEEYIATIIRKPANIIQLEYQLKMRNIINNKENVLILETLPKAIYAYDNIVAINYGTSVDFVNTNGWVLKKYKSSQEINSIVLNNNVAGIIYKDRIELINL